MVITAPTFSAIVTLRVNLIEVGVYICPLIFGHCCYLGYHFISLYYIQGSLLQLDCVPERCDKYWYIVMKTTMNSKVVMLARICCAPLQLAGDPS